MKSLLSSSALSLRGSNLPSLFRTYILIPLSRPCNFRTHIPCAFRFFFSEAFCCNRSIFLQIVYWTSWYRSSLVKPLFPPFQISCARRLQGVFGSLPTPPPSFFSFPLFSACWAKTCDVLFPRVVSVFFFGIFFCFSGRDDTL